MKTNSFYEKSDGKTIVILSLISVMPGFIAFARQKFFARKKAASEVKVDQ